VRATTGAPARGAPEAGVKLVEEAREVVAASRMRVEASYAPASDPRVVFSLEAGAAVIERWGEATCG
jgi:hypothetical protein